MSPRRKSGLGRTLSAHSPAAFARRWDVSLKTARRLAKMEVSHAAMVDLVRDYRRRAAAQERNEGGMPGELV